VTIKAIIPLGYTRSLLKLTRGDLKGRNLSRSTFSYWKEVDNVYKVAIIYEDSPGVKSFYISMITKGSPCGYFTPLVSFSENRMFLFVLLCLRGGILWTLFTCLCYDFLRDLKDPPVYGLLVIIFISLIALCGRLDVLSSSLGTTSCFSLLSLLELLDSPFFTNFCSFPFQMSSSIRFFRSLQTSV